MIEIRQNTIEVNGFEKEVFHFNGRLAKDTGMSRLKGERRWELGTDDADVRGLLLGARIDELRKQFLNINFYTVDHIHRNVNGCYIDLSKKKASRVEFISRYEYDQWQQPFLISDYFDVLEHVGNSFAGRGVAVSTHLHDYPVATVSFPIADLTAPLSDEINRHVPVLKELLDMAWDEVRAAIPPDSLVAYFRFPREIQAACTQYLTYFSQFLQDLGIDATIDLRQEAHRVLFTATPNSGDEALHSIQQALVAYLRLPSLMGRRGIVTDSTDLAVMQLDANVRHLHAQVELARGVIDAKDAAIESLKLVNFQYKQMLRAAGTYAEISAPKSQDAVDTEPLIGKVVSVAKFRIKGLEIDLPALLRMLKRICRR